MSVMHKCGWLQSYVWTYICSQQDKMLTRNCMCYTYIHQSSRITVCPPHNRDTIMWAPPPHPPPIHPPHTRIALHCIALLQSHILFSWCVLAVLGVASNQYGVVPSLWSDGGWVLWRGFPFAKFQGLLFPLQWGASSSLKNTYLEGFHSVYRTNGNLGLVYQWLTLLWIEEFVYRHCM